MKESEEHVLELTELETLNTFETRSGMKDVKYIEMVYNANRPNQ